MTSLITTGSEDGESARADLRRRTLLGLGAGAMAGVAAGGLGAPALGVTAKSKALRWPIGKLPASAARRVDRGEFFSTQLLRSYGHEADALGLRATGSATTERYVRRLKERLERAGLKRVRLEAVPMRQWLARSWSLTVAGRTLPSTYYMPYSQRTSTSGVTAPMVYLPVAESISNGTSTAEAIGDSLAASDVNGKIVVFEVPYTSLPISGFAILSYPGGFQIGDHDPTGIYRRPWFNSAADVVDAAIAAGAAGVIGIWPDLAGSWARQYTPYDGIFRTAPGLWVDSIEGRKLKEEAYNGATATIILQADIRHTVTHNVIGFIPGKSKQLTVLHTHTDGTNGMEENGQIGILASAQYLARLPKNTRDRTIMVFFSTGHFAGGNGIRHFLAKHQDDLVPWI